MFGMFRRNKMNDTPWNAYEIMAPNTAMLSSVAPIAEPAFSAPSQNHTTMITSNPNAAPVNDAADTVASPYLAHRGHFTALPHPEIGIVAHEGLRPGERVPFLAVDAGERIDDADGFQVATIQWLIHVGSPA